jgi:hypothetical protein
MAFQVGHHLPGAVFPLTWETIKIVVYKATYLPNATSHLRQIL